MPCQITHVHPGSVADRLGIEKGDTLVTISGEQIIDQIDYQALTASSSFPMEIMKPSGKIVQLSVRKGDWEPMGLTLDQTIVSNPRPCKNHCVFCFIDQMPPDMRSTLYVKDDDWRLSLMMGNYITMTNISESELDRIICRKVSPLFVSVHATQPEERVKLLRNPAAGKIMENLTRLKNAGIRFHCQIVLCPGWNDGDVLMQTLRDLASLMPAAQSVALVPVGLTKFREGLNRIEPYNRHSAEELIRQMQPVQQEFLEKTGTRFVFPADEFYCLSSLPLPADEEYEDYPQAENGVGMLRLFESDLQFASEDTPVEETAERNLLVVCGTSVAKYMQEWCDKYAPRGTHAKVRSIVNKFFGESVTVTGLITGRDMVEQLQNEKCDKILICRNMIRSEGDLFLDGMSLQQVREALPAPLQVVENTGDSFWKALAGLEE